MTRGCRASGTEMTPLADPGADLNAREGRLGLRPWGIGASGIRLTPDT